MTSLKNSNPLAGYENHPPLPTATERDSNGKRYFFNPAIPSLSPAYASFSAPVKNGLHSGYGFDAHIYFMQTNQNQVAFVRALHSRIRYEFPELRIYELYEHPVGPHPTGSFEVDLWTPEQFGAFVPWLMCNRGELSVLVHPNTDFDEVRDHTKRAIWLGEKWPVDVEVLEEGVRMVMNVEDMA